MKCQARSTIALIICCKCLVDWTYYVRTLAIIAQLIISGSASRKNYEIKRNNAWARYNRHYISFFLPSIYLTHALPVCPSSWSVWLGLIHGPDHEYIISSSFKCVKCSWSSYFFFIFLSWSIKNYIVCYLLRKLCVHMYILVYILAIVYYVCVSTYVGMYVCIPNSL